MNWEEWSRLLHCLPVYPTYRLDASHCYVPVREISCGNMCDTRPFLSLFIAKNSSFLRTLSFLIYLETAGLITIERVPLLFFTGVSYAYTARVWIDCFPWRQPPPPYTHRGSPETSGRIKMDASIFIRPVRRSQVISRTVRRGRGPRLTVSTYLLLLLLLLPGSVSLLSGSRMADYSSSSCFLLAPSASPLACF